MSALKRDTRVGKVHKVKIKNDNFVFLSMYLPACRNGKAAATSACCDHWLLSVTSLCLVSPRPPSIPCLRLDCTQWVKRLLCLSCAPPAVLAVSLSASAWTLALDFRV